ncbi:ferrochelatase [Rickettsia felis]|uniref:ferrochelatase n=1 Tax=Rickettsia felis TaxID=42862 RepID=UPI000AC28A93|nr:ferrochelatase [Rickettsia felis]
MRYSAPFAKEVIDQIKKYNPSEIILLPLYPQFSSTTTGSSVKNFLQNFDIDISIKTICCYPQEEDFIKSHVSLIKEKLYDDDKNFVYYFLLMGYLKK